MAQINHFNAVPVYTRLDDQQRYCPGCELQFGLLSFKDQLPAFQFFHPLAGGRAYIPHFRMINAETGEASASVNSLALFDGEVTGDTQIYTFLGGDVAADFSDSFCGLYYLEIKRGSTYYYTDVFRLVDFEVKDNYYRIRAWDDVDSRTAMYQTGFKQDLILEGYPPKVLTDTEEDINLNGENLESINYLSVKERHTIDFRDVPDYCTPFLESLRGYDNVTIQNLATMVTVTCSEIKYTKRDQGPCLNIGSLSYLAAQYFKAGVQENFVLV